MNTSLNSKQRGYIQLVAPDGRVIAQVLAAYADKLSTWKQPGAIKKYVMSSGLVHPQHFFAPVKRDADVQIFATRKRVRRWWSVPKPLPFANLPLIHCKASVLEGVDIDEMVKGGTGKRAYGWKAIIGNEIVGERIKISN